MLRKELQTPQINNELVEEYGHEPTAREIAEKVFEMREADDL
ncbi:hypothetical protein [Clostridium gasigenes]|nr:hypothetical protein [Clostridium gasigenes]